MRCLTLISCFKIMFPETLIIGWFSTYKSFIKADLLDSSTRNPSVSCPYSVEKSKYTQLQMQCNYAGFMWVVLMYLSVIVAESLQAYTDRRLHCG